MSNFQIKFDKNSIKASPSTPPIGIPTRGLYFLTKNGKPRFCFILSLTFALAATGRIRLYSDALIAPVSTPGCGKAFQRAMPLCDVILSSLSVNFPLASKTTYPLSSLTS